jgi:hypothetical protein
VRSENSFDSIHLLFSSSSSALHQPFSISHSTLHPPPSTNPSTLHTPRNPTKLLPTFGGASFLLLRDDEVLGIHEVGTFLQ